MVKMDVDLCGLTNAITDIIVNVQEDELKEIGLKKGFFNSSAKISYTDFLKVIKGKGQEIIPGGSPANVIRGTSRHGLKTALFGTIGNDEYGEGYLKNLHDYDIQSFLNICEGESGICYNLITPDGEKTSIARIGVSKEYDFDLTKLKGAKIFHTSGYELMTNPERTKESVYYAKNLKALISFDLADPEAIKRERGILDEILFTTDILFATEEECKELCGDSDNLREICPVAILKKGKNGSEVMQGKHRQIIPVYNVSVKGTNGAGDAYATAFLSAYIKNYSMGECGHAASKYASKICSIQKPYL